MPTSDPKDEYKDLSDNMRHYGNMRFVQLTLFIALTAGLLKAIFTFDPALASLVKFVLKIGGVITAVVFLIMEERAADYWHHFRRRAVELEKQIGFQQYSTRLGRDVVSATNAARMLYTSILLF